MNTPVHFDLDSAEKSIRAGMKETTAEALRLAPSDEDRRMVRLQGELEDFMVAFARWDMGRVNNGGHQDDALAAEAFGYTVGNLIASFVMNTGDESLSQLVMGALCKAVNTRLYGAPDENAVHSQTQIKSMLGGNA